MNKNSSRVNYQLPDHRMLTVRYRMKLLLIGCQLIEKIWLA